MNEFGNVAAKRAPLIRNEPAGIAVARENKSAEEIIKNLQIEIGASNAILDNITAKLDPVLISDYPRESATDSSSTGDTILQNALLSVKQNLHSLNERLNYIHGRIII